MTGLYTYNINICLYIGEGNGNPLQYSCPGNPMDRRAWWATVQGVAKSRTRLKQLSIHTCTYIKFNINNKYICIKLYIIKYYICIKLLDQL